MTALIILETVRMSPLLGGKGLLSDRFSGVLGVAAGIGFIEVSSIAVNGVNHVSFAVCDDGWILGSDVIQELF